MRKRLILVFAEGLALGCLGSVWAQAQSGMELSLPPNSQRTAQFSFANSCPTEQRFRVTAQPAAEWLHFVDPATVDVKAGDSIDFRFTVRTSDKVTSDGRKSKLRVVCISCAGTEPPCLQSIREVPVILTIGSLGSVGNVEAAPSPSLAPKTVPIYKTARVSKVVPPSKAVPAYPGHPAGVGKTENGLAVAQPSAMPDSTAPSSPRGKWLLLCLAGGLLVAAAATAGVWLAVRGGAGFKPFAALRGAPGAPDSPDFYPGQSERHRVRW
jgi:hypothetical protein